jgi:hypothetical protein
LKAKLAPIAFCLLFALPFGGVGLGAAWAMATMVYDGLRAQDWVRVKATVSETSGTYHYTVGGRQYANDRRGTVRIDGTSDVDDFDQRVASILESGRSEKRPITVWVNPDNPAESMVDRDIRWMLFVFLVPFALAFGGVGVGALWVIGKILREPGRTASGKARTAQAVAAAPLRSAGSGLGGIWFMAILWNALSFPIAILAVPQGIASGEWLVLLVLLFPLVGLALLWAAIRGTVGRLRRGRAAFRVSTATPRVGSPLEGSVEFAQGVKPGDAFNVRIVCERTFDNGGETSITQHWTRSVTAKAIAAPTGLRVPFRIEIPSNVPASDADGDDKPVRYRWRLEAEPVGQRMTVPYRHDVVFQKAAFAEPRTATLQARAKLEPGLEQVLGRFNPAGLTAEQRQAFAQLTPDQQQKLGRFIAFLPSGRKIVIAVVCIWVAMEVVPMIYSLVR